ncbi:nucleoside diphosphate kinase [Platysternon megacephalum]|uniref:Nucleoside diphosphate kinase n=1 Tax=Platysternon megacephalum TaxID=55544 RepID=A0A4D9DH65_9SAUR|nr:nucleoside diphosphate kinase [Platysternon megacephalum]
MTFQYPPTARGDVVDVLHGKRISDPYRWLEEPDSDETRAWVQAQVDCAEGYLAGLPDREWFRRTARGYVLQDFAAEPQYLHGYYVQARVFTDKPQPVMYFARTLSELEAGEGSVLVDPNAFSDDGTSALGALKISRDGRLLAYGRSDAGSDWNRIYVVDIASGEVVDESIVTKFCAPEFTPDGKAFFYTSYEETGRTDGVDTSSLPLGHVALHTVGADVETDRRIWTNPGDPMVLPGVQVSVEGDRLILQQYYGTERFNKVWVYPLTSGGDGVSFGDPVRFVDEFVDDIECLGRDGRRRRGGGVSDRRRLCRR